MEQLLIFIKHRLGFLWGIIDRINGWIFTMFYGSKLKKILPGVFNEFSDKHFIYRVLREEDIKPLHDLITSQPPDDIKYFSPHKFDMRSLLVQFRKPAFLMMGVFDGEKMIGYFILRFFANKRCFVGRLIDTNYRGKGIGEVMNSIMYDTAWKMHFRCLSTISRNNTAVMRAHAKNGHVVILKELRDDYLLVEFVEG